MKLEIIGIASDIQEMVAPMVAAMGEKLKITISPCPPEGNLPQRFYVIVESKSKTEKGE